VNAPLRPRQIGTPWPRVRLGEIAEHRLGKMLDKAKNTGIPRRYLRNPNVRWFDVDLSDLKEILVEERDIHKYELQTGDVVICEGGEAGRAALWEGQAGDIIFQKAIHRVRVGPKLDARFLIHRLMFDYFNGGLEDYYTGATIKHFTGQDLARYEIPLPPLDEQRRIAAILDKADALLRKQRAAEQLVSELAGEIFISMFGTCKPGATSWPTSKVSEAGRIQLGRQRAPKYQTGKFKKPYVRVANVYEDRIDTTDILSMDFNERDFRDYRLEYGDILLNEGQSTELVGRPAMWRSEIEDCCFQNTLIRFQVDVEQVIPEFALGLFLQYFRTGEFSKISSKTSSVAHLGAGRFGLMPFPIPPLNLQKDFAKRLETVKKLKEIHRTEASLITSLFSSLQSRAFSGRL
jgi:type I restriction enzyme S subunit